MPNSRAPSSPVKCALLLLPAELRNTICHLVLPHSTILRPNVHNLFKAAERREITQKPFPRHETVLALGRTCQQLYSETISIYFGENTFSFDNGYDLYRYLYMIGLERRRCIKSIEVFLRGVSYWQYGGKMMPIRNVYKLAFDLVADCTLLRKLNLGVSSETTDGMKKQTDLCAIRDTGALSGIRGLGNVELKVREVCNWGDRRQSAFETDIKETKSRLPWFPFFSIRHVEEFERILREDLKAAKEHVEEEGDDECEDEMQLDELVVQSQLAIKAMKGVKSLTASSRRAGKKGMRKRRRRG